MQLKYGLISVDDHIQEPPDLWTRRLSKNHWGDRIPYLQRLNDGTEQWSSMGNCSSMAAPAEPAR